MADVAQPKSGGAAALSGLAWRLLIDVLHGVLLFP
jgi:hypothetical protein